jgi:hypothetical protein
MPTAFKPVLNALPVVHSRALATQASADNRRRNLSVGRAQEHDGFHADGACSDGLQAFDGHQYLLQSCLAEWLSLDRSPLDIYRANTDHPAVRPDIVGDIHRPRLLALILRGSNDQPGSQHGDNFFGYPQVAHTTGLRRSWVFPQKSAAGEGDRLRQHTIPKYSIDDYNIYITLDLNLGVLILCCMGS